jgi:hypothetical protein
MCAMMIIASTLKFEYPYEVVLAVLLILGDILGFLFFVYGIMLPSKKSKKKVKNDRKKIL